MNKPEYYLSYDNSNEYGCFPQTIFDQIDLSQDKANRATNIVARSLSPDDWDGIHDEMKFNVFTLT